MPFVSSLPHSLVSSPPAITPLFISTISSHFLSLALAGSRSDRVPGDDGRGLRVGGPGWSNRPAADAAHLPLHQQRVCLLLVLHAGLRLLPLLPPGLRCGVRRQMGHTGWSETTTTVARQLRGEIHNSKHTLGFKEIPHQSLGCVQFGNFDKERHYRQKHPICGQLSEFGYCSHYNMVIMDGSAIWAEHFPLSKWSHGKTNLRPCLIAELWVWLLL